MNVTHRINEVLVIHECINTKYKMNYYLNNIH